MSDGGRFPWKAQKINAAPAVDYRQMRLGEPPAGWEWVQNKVTREWTLREKEVDAVALPMSGVVVGGVDEIPCSGAVAECVADGEHETVPIAHAEPIHTTDYLHRHRVTEDDTFQGICLRYKVTPTQLRQANNFSGTNLRLAPGILKIPFAVKAAKATEEEIAAAGRIEEQEKIVQVGRACGGLSRNESRAYLAMNDWDVNNAVTQALEDIEFERDGKGSLHQGRHLRH